MVVDATSGLIDETPWEVDDKEDQRGGSTGSLYTFPRMPWYENRSTRILVGSKLNSMRLRFYGSRLSFC